VCAEGETLQSQLAVAERARPRFAKFGQFYPAVVGGLIDIVNPHQVNDFESQSQCYLCYLLN
jgi:hypothetical protein